MIVVAALVTTVIAGCTRELEAEITGQALSAGTYGRLPIPPSTDAEVPMYRLFREYRDVTWEPYPAFAHDMTLSADGSLTLHAREHFYWMDEEARGVRVQVTPVAGSWSFDEEGDPLYAYVPREAFEGGVATVRLVEESMPETPVRVEVRVIGDTSETWRSGVFTVPVGGIVHSAYGLLRDWPTLDGGRFAFAAAVVREGERRETQLGSWEMMVTYPDGTGWRDISLDLSSFEGERVQLILSAEQVEGEARTDAVHPMWMYPQLVARGEAPAEAPSVILLSLDTLRADHLSFLGYDRETSPNLTKFAEECVIFEQAIAASTWTTPSHASMFTGALPWDHGAGSWKRSGKLEDSWVTVAELAREADYTTAAFTEGGAVGAGMGFLQGFEQYNDGQFEARPWSGTAVMMLNRAERWMLQRRADPFFTFLHTFEIHAPYCSPPPEGLLFVPEGAPETTCLFEAQIDSPRLTAHGVDLYDGGILYTDWVLGDFLENLRRGGVLDNAVLIITADHGEEFGEHGSLGHLSHIYEEVIHVPLMIRFPGGRWGGTRVKELVATRDLHATLAELMGVPAERRYPGSQSFLSLVDPQAGKTPYTREHVFSHLSLGDDETAAPTEAPYEAQHFSVRSLTGRYMVSDKAYLQALEAGAAGDLTPWKHEAYDRVADPGEQVNLAEEPSPELAALRAVLLERLAQDGQLEHLTGPVVHSGGGVSRESIEEMEAMGYF